MGIINLTRGEKEALSSMKTDELSKAIDKAIDDRSASTLYGLQLSSCGPYVVEQNRIFTRDVFAFAQAKSSRKLEETGERARRSGYNLLCAVRQMQERMKVEEEEGKFFEVDDHIFPPITPSSRVSVRVYYRWRKTIDDDWQSGSIVFTHTVVMRQSYNPNPPKRKPSAAKQREQLEAECYDTWERVMKGALYHVQEYFRSGRDGSLIPDEFRVKADAQGYLNNFSTKFWQETP